MTTALEPPQAEALARLGHNPWREVVERVFAELCPTKLQWSGDVFSVVHPGPIGVSFIRSGSISRWSHDGSLVKLGIFLGGGWDGDFVEMTEAELRTEVYWLMQRKRTP